MGHSLAHAPVEPRRDSPSLESTPTEVGPTEVGPGDTVGNAEAIERLGLGSEAPRHGAAVTGREDAGICHDVGPMDIDELDRISRFADTIRALLAPWEAQRLTSDLVFDATAVNAAMAAMPRTWDREDLREALDRGTTRDRVREITSFNLALSPTLVELLDIHAADLLHHGYTLTMHEGFDAGAVLGVRSMPATLDYHNDAGMSWSMEGRLVFGEGRFGIGVELDEDGPGMSLPEAPHLEGLSAEDPMEATTPIRVYYRPEDYGDGMAYLLSGSLQAGVSGSAGSIGRGGYACGPSGIGISLQHEGRTLDFTQGEALACGSSVGAEAEHDDLGLSGGVDVDGLAAIGTVVGEGPASATGEVRPLAEHDRPTPDPEIAATASVYFRTGESTLDDADIEELEELIGIARQISAEFPGAVWHASVTGYATRRWRSARTEDDALAANTELAHARAAVVDVELWGRLRDQDVDIDPRVVEASEPVDVDAGPIVGDHADADQAEGRRVDIVLRWHPCDPLTRM